MLSLSSPIENLPKTTKPLIAALKKLGILIVQDVLLYFPYRYLDFSKVSTIKELKPGESVSISATIKNISSRFSFRSHLSLAEAVVSDETGSIKVVWFNQPYLAKSLKPGDEVFLAGTPDYYNFGLQLTNPIYEKASDFPVHTARLVPIYHLSQTIYPKTFRNLIASVLPMVDEVIDILPENIIKNQKLLNIHNTISFSHFPESLEQVEQAKKRLAFEEIFLNQLLAQRHKLELAKKMAYVIKFNQNLVKSFVDSLPFTLTNGQKKATWDILQDIEKPIPMNRLVEGDVGSGKTLVALTAALEAATAGLQVAFLAPTEILAQQHYATSLKYLVDITRGRAEYKLMLLTNSYAKINNSDEGKTKVQKMAAEGLPGLYIGTHALLAKKVKFKNLALVIIDEQHRFGVEQRAELIKSDTKVPHLLSLTATPIPRTLQLAFYGDLDISQIKSKPAGRKVIITNLIDKNQRPKAYNFIGQEIKNGRQVFVITPLIEESDKLGVKSAKAELENLKKIFPKFNIGLMHGRLKGSEKEAVMKDFLENKIQILVSTSVVEVGVDIPNASVMVIEAAERFGLAQLHQFRGRVGRAEHQSHCMLFTENETEDVIKRLTDFTKTSDGFELAELDLKQRGFGELYGSQQSGWDFKYFNPSYIALIEPARQEARKLLEKGLNLDNFPLLKEKIKDKVVHFE